MDREVRLDWLGSFVPLYMLLLFSHVGGMTWQHFRSGWFVGALIVALIWVPMLLSYEQLQQLNGKLYLIVSFAPVILWIVFLSVLFANA